MATQNNAILKHLQAGHSLTPVDALNLFGCFRLAARIHELRFAAKIENEWVKGEDGKRWKRYWIAGGEA